MNKISACDMTEAYIDQVVEIENLSFKTPWSKQDFINELTQNKYALYRIILVDDKVAAYGGVWMLFDEGHITNIAVHPEFRGKGFGNMAVEELINASKKNNLKALTLEVREHNITALNLYKKYGFEVVGIRKGYYQDTKEDAFIMWKYNL